MSCGQQALAAMSGLWFQPLTPQNKAHMGNPALPQAKSPPLKPPRLQDLTGMLHQVQKTARTECCGGKHSAHMCQRERNFIPAGMRILKCASFNMSACLPGGSDPIATSRSCAALPTPCNSFQSPLCPQERPSWAQQRHFLSELLTGPSAEQALYCYSLCAIIYFFITVKHT